MGAGRVMTATSNAATDARRRHAPPGGAERMQTPREAGREAGLEQPRRSMAIGAVLMAMAVVVVDAGLSNVALPTIAGSLHVAPSQAILVVTSYQVAVVMWLLPCAALAERFGYRRVFASGVAVFGAASIASALSPSLAWLITARFIQGLGGAAILTLGVALLRFSVAETRLSAMIGWSALTVALSAAAGPAVGALIISHADWRWLYVASIPLAIGVLLATRALPAVEEHAAPLDLVSIALNCAVFGLFVIGAELFIKATAAAAASFLAGALAFAMLIRREAPKARPLIPLDLLRNTSFRTSIIASICCFTGQTAGLIALPFYLQHELAQSTVMAGLYMTAWPLSVAATATVTGRLVNWAPTRWLCFAGGGLLAIGLVAAALWPLNGDPRLLAPFTAICGVGFGLFQVANNRNMFLSAPSTRSGAAGGMQGTARLTGQTAGAVMAAQLFALCPMSLAPHIGLGIGAFFTLAAGLISLLQARAR